MLVYLYFILYSIGLIFYVLVPFVYKKHRYRQILWAAIYFGFTIHSSVFLTHYYFDGGINFFLFTAFLAFLPIGLVILVWKAFKFFRKKSIG